MTGPHGMTEMRQFTAIVLALTLLGSASAYAQGMEVAPNGSRPATKGAAENFTGSVVVEPLYPATDRMRSAGGHVTFEPGARSAWHAHPAGQILIVTAGAGWIQEEGGEKREIKPGDVIWTPPGVKHWHGATPTNGMSHIAITNVADGKTVAWMEQVSEEQDPRLSEAAGAFECARHLGNPPGLQGTGAWFWPGPASRRCRRRGHNASEKTN